MLTVARLSRWSIGYYERTAAAAREAGLGAEAAGGGLGEYYSEKDTRAPVWVIAGDGSRVADGLGLGEAAASGGFADGGVVSRWLDDGVVPSGLGGYSFGKRSVHGFDLTFSAPKSVSLVRALGGERAEKAVLAAHERALGEAMTYVFEHAGYTRVKNPVTKELDLVRLPGLVGVAYQHETSRCGDPHLHTHVVVPNRQLRADGRLASIDSKSLLHEAKAAGMIYQSVLRHELHAELSMEWKPVAQHSGMAEIAGIPEKVIKRWSRRSTQLRQWAADNLTIVDGQPSVQQLAAAQKATRPAKPENMSWQQLKHMWLADERGGLGWDRSEHEQARSYRRQYTSNERAEIAKKQWKHVIDGIDKAAFTRADMIEVIAPTVPVGIEHPGGIREFIEWVVDNQAIRVTEARHAHQREGSERYTTSEVLQEEERLLELADARSTRASLWFGQGSLRNLSPAQQKVVRGIGHSQQLVQPLQAPAGAGKTTSLKMLRQAAHVSRNLKTVVIAPTGRAVDEAVRAGAAETGHTVHSAVYQINHGHLDLKNRLVIVDEASMIGTPDLLTLVHAAVGSGAKIVLVGDPWQLSPVQKRGGMFAQLCDELPWSQRLSEVWRMRDPAERDASIAIRSARGNRLRSAVGWYRTHDRVHIGDELTMAHDATSAYITAVGAGKDAVIIADRRELVDQINTKLHHHYSQGRDHEPTIAVGRGQQVREGDLIMSLQNDPDSDVRHTDLTTAADQVRNGNRWRVREINTKDNVIAAQRLTDGAVTLFGGDYLRQHVSLGYAGTVQSAQGITVGDNTRPGICHTIVSENASRSLAYVGLTRAKDENHAFIYHTSRGEAEHEHTTPTSDAEIVSLTRGTKHHAAAALHRILCNDDRAQTLHTTATQAAATEHNTPDTPHVTNRIGQYLTRNTTRITNRAATWRHHQTQQHRQADGIYLGRIRRRAQERHKERTRQQTRGRYNTYEHDSYGLEL